MKCFCFVFSVSSIDHNTQEFVIHYDTYNSDVVLSVDSVLPLGMSNQNNCSTKKLTFLFELLNNLPASVLACLIYFDCSIGNFSDLKM